MRYFVAVDMEGVTGVVHAEQLMPEGRLYGAARDLLLSDILAVVEGINLADSEALIAIGDGHGPMHNVCLERLPPNCLLVSGPGNPLNKSLCQLEGISRDFDALLLVGFHAKAGTPNSVLAHTFIGSVVANMFIGNQKVGEVQVNAAIAGSFGVPLIMVSGNAEVEAELAVFGCSLPFVSTKTSLGPNAAVCLPPSQTRTQLIDAAKTAVERMKTTPPRTYLPDSSDVLAVEFYRVEMADKAETAGGMVRVGDRTLQAPAADFADSFRMVWRGLVRAVQEYPDWLR